MAVSFGLRSKRPRLESNAVSKSFAEAAALDKDPPALSPEEALAKSEQEQVCLLRTLRLWPQPRGKPGCKLGVINILLLACV